MDRQAQKAADITPLQVLIPSWLTYVGHSNAVFTILIGLRPTVTEIAAQRNRESGQPAPLWLHLLGYSA